MVQCAEAKRTVSERPRKKKLFHPNYVRLVNSFLTQISPTHELTYIKIRAPEHLQGAHNLLGENPKPKNHGLNMDIY